MTLEELSASISEATGTDVEEVANAIFYAYNTPFDGDGKYAKITSYTMATTSVVVDLYTFLEVHENPETGEKTLFIDFERAESICNHWSAIYITYNECKKERPWRCVNFKKAQ